MASNDDLSEQLTLTSRLAAQVERMAAAAERLEGSYRTQLDSVQKLAAAYGQVNTQGAVQGIETLNKVLRDASSKMNDVGKTSETAFQKLGKKVEEAGKTISQKFPKGVVVATSALSGLTQGFRNLIALGKGLTGFTSSFVDGLANITASIISIPFKMFSGLIDLAAKSAGGSTELAEAIEKLRKQFGALYGPTNKAIIDTSKSLKGFSDTGLSAWRVFGNLANRLNELRELATEMGGAFSKVRQEFEDNGGALLAYQKGLGIANEDMKAVVRNAVAMGKKTSDSLKDMTKFSYELGEAFKLDAKLISRDMSKALSDVKHFGGATVKQIAEASTYARKLGFELKDITGTLDAFDTFDTAAENAAKLSQAFGVNIDAFELMKAQSPDEQLEMLRKSFKSAGIDASNFDRASLKLAATTTGLSEEIVQSALSLKNQGMSLDEIKKKGGDAEKKTLTQAQAMSKLADAIERMVMSGGAMSGSFWDQFVKGFLGGIQSSKEFREIMWNIQRALRETYYQGVKLGRAFVQAFPGVKQFLGGIADFFNPAKFRKLVGGTVSVIEDWMKDLTEPGGKASFASLMDRLKEKFFDFFDSESSSGRQMVNGFKTVFKTIAKTTSEGIKWVSDKVADGIKWIVGLINGDVNISALGAKAGNELGFFGQALMPLVDSLRHAWKVVAPALWDLVKTLTQKLVEILKSKEVSDALRPAMPYVAAAIAGVLFGPAFTRAVLGAIVSSLVKGTGSAIQSVGKKAFKGLISKAAEATEHAEKVPTKAGTDNLKKVAEVNKAAGEAVKMTGAKDWGVRDAVKLGLKLVAIATALSVGGVEMAAAIWAMKKIMDNAGIREPKDVVPQIAALAGMAGAAVPLMLALRLADKIGKPSEIAKGGAAISLAVGIVGLTAGVLAGLLGLITTPQMLDAVGTMMLKMSGVFLAMVPLIIASMAIGALASGPQAAALAVAAIGLGVIGVAVAEMAGISVAIIESLSRLKIDVDFQRKIDAFLGVMKSVQSFTDSIVKVIESMQPSLIGFLTGTEEKFTEKIAAAQGLIAEMVGRSGAPGGLIGIVEVVESTIGRLGRGGPNLETGAKVFQAVMESVSTVLRALVPPDSFFEAGNDFLQRLVDPSWNYSSLTADVKHYAQVMQEQLMSMLGRPGKGGTGILGIVDTLATISLPNPDSASKVASLISSIAGITRSITPDPETLKSMQTSGVDAQYAWGLMKFDSKKQGVKPEDIARIIREKVEGIRTVMSAITDGPVMAIMNMNVPKEKLEGLKVVTDVMKVVVDLARAIGESTPKGNITIPKEAHDVVFNMIPSVSGILNGMKDNLYGLMMNLVGIVKNVPKDKDFLKNLETTKTLFGFIGEISKLTDSLAAAGGNVNNVDPLVNAVNSARVFLGRLLSDYGESPLGMLIDNIRKVDSMLSNAPIASIDRSMASIKKTISVTNDLADGFTPMIESANKAMNVIPKDGLAPTIKAVSDMVKAANDLNSALANGNLNKIDIKTKLENVAKSVGLGGKASYTINPSKEVVITVNMYVTMDAGKVERVILQREGSILRDRINFATNNPTERSVDEIPNSPNKHVTFPVTGGGTVT